MARRIAQPTGRGTFRAGDGKFRSETPASMREAVRKVTEDMRGKVAMQAHGRKGKR